MGAVMTPSKRVFLTFKRSDDGTLSIRLTPTYEGAGVAVLYSRGMLASDAPVEVTLPGAEVAAAQLEAAVAAYMTAHPPAAPPPPLRVERYEVKAKAGGGWELAFGAAFETPPAVLTQPVMVGDQLFLAVATAVTKAGATGVLKRSRGTLLLTTGPLEAAAANQAGLVLAIGN